MSGPRLRRSLSLPLLVIVALVPAACGATGPAGRAEDGRPLVVASTTQAADLARQVGGDRISVRGIMGPNSDPHEFEPRTGDAAAMGEARLVVRSGGDVDSWLAALIDGAGGDDIEELTLIDHVQVRHGGHADEAGHEHGAQDRARPDGHGAEDEHDTVDPHWWQDPRNVERAVAALRDRLIAIDPAGRAEFVANAQRYTARLQALDRAVAACVEQVPTRRRVLVTTHDALGYYAARYGIRVVGTVIPSLSTQGQPSAGELADLAADIRAAGVRTVFAESSVNSKVEAAIARESGAKVGPALWADTLGPAGSDGAQLIGSIAANTHAVVAGMTGRPDTCALPTS